MCIPVLTRVWWQAPGNTKSVQRLRGVFSVAPLQSGSVLQGHSPARGCSHWFPAAKRAVRQSWKAQQAKKGTRSFQEEPGISRRGAGLAQRRSLGMYLGDPQGRRGILPWGGSDVRERSAGLPGTLSSRLRRNLLATGFLSLHFF